MVTDFFATTIDDWDDPSGALHAYLVPGPDVRSRLAPAMEAARGVPFLAVQPEDSVHATILRLPALVRDLSDDDVERIRATASAACTALGPLTITFGAPTVTSDSLLVSAGADEKWAALVESVRKAAEQALGLDAHRYPHPRAPHMTLAYATSDGDDGLVHAALDSHEGATSSLGAVAFTKILWCGVHQLRHKGIYTFDVLFETPLSQ